MDLLDSDRREGPIFEREWSTKVKGLGLHANNLRADIGPLGAQEFSEVNLFSAYDGKKNASVFLRNSDIRFRYIPYSSRTG